MRSSNLYEGRNGKGLISGFCGLLFLFFVIFALTGCDGNVFEGFSDDDSYEARIDEAQIALDDADYSRALSILLALRADFPNKSEVLRYLSNAYAGLAGLDTFNLLKTIDQLEEQNDEGDIDMVGLVLGGADGILTSTEIDNKLTNFENAINALEGISAPTADEKVQLGLLSLNHAALTIADIIDDDNPLSDSVTLTEEGIRGLYDGGTPDFTAEATTERLNSLSDDIVRIDESVDAIATITGADTDNDLSESADEFQNDIDPDGDESITQQELQNYVGTL